MAGIRPLRPSLARDFSVISFLITRATKLSPAPLPPIGFANSYKVYSNQRSSSSFIDPDRPRK